MKCLGCDRISPTRKGFLIVNEMRHCKYCSDCQLKMINEYLKKRGVGK